MIREALIGDLKVNRSKSAEHVGMIAVLSYLGGEN